MLPKITVCCTVSSFLEITTSACHASFLIRLQEIFLDIFSAYGYLQMDSGDRNEMTYDDLGKCSQCIVEYSRAALFRGRYCQEAITLFSNLRRFYFD